jgi:hypothetical protein
VIRLVTAATMMVAAGARAKDRRSGAGSSRTRGLARLGLSSASARRLRGRASQPHESPRCSRLATEMSSSIASQCIPMPPPIDSQSLRCRGVAARTRGNHTNGTETVRPSSRTTTNESSEQETSTANASALSTEVGIPLRQEPVPTNPQQGWHSVSLLRLAKSGIARRKPPINGAQDV